MAISRLAEQPVILRELRTTGHAHFWERAMSRGVFVKRAAGVGGVMLTSGMWMPALARAGGGPPSGAPKPVPANGALGGLHIYLPGVNSEPSAITDLNGFVGIGAVTGAGTATSASGSTQRLYFD